jgi:hypothetical protein
MATYILPEPTLKASQPGVVYAVIDPLEWATANSVTFVAGDNVIIPFTNLNRYQHIVFAKFQSTSNADQLSIVNWQSTADAIVGHTPRRSGSVALGTTNSAGFDMTVEADIMTGNVSCIYSIVTSVSVSIRLIVTVYETLTNIGYGR